MAGLTPLKRQRPTNIVGDMIVLSLLLPVLSFSSFLMFFGLCVKRRKGDPFSQPIGDCENILKNRRR
jgi:hypothetical protein